MAYIKRHAENTIKRLIKEYKIVMITGQRQVGKTTILENLKEKIDLM